MRLQILYELEKKYFSWNAEAKKLNILWYKTVLCRPLKICNIFFEKKLNENIRS